MGEWPKFEDTWLQKIMIFFIKVFMFYKLKPQIWDFNVNFERRVTNLWFNFGMIDWKIWGTNFQSRERWFQMDFGSIS